MKKQIPIEEENKISDKIRISGAGKQGVLSEVLLNLLDLTGTDKSSSTLRSYRLAIKNFVELIGEIPVENITPEHTNLFKAKRQLHVAASSVNVDLRSLKAIFSVLEQWERIPKNPFRKVKLVREPEKEMRYLTEAEFKSVTENISNRTLFTIVHCAYYTGARIGEILNLTWDCIHFEDSYLTIRNHKDFTTKSKRIRDVSLHPELKILLQQHYERTNSSEYVFTNKSGRRYRGDTISKMFKKVCRKAGLDESVHFHGLRHTCASRLVQKGAPIYAVSKILGHSSVKVTERYAHLSQNHQKSYINLL